MDNKPEADWLTKDEHRSLQRLWKQAGPVGRMLPLPTSYANADERSDARTDRALGVLRILEEQLGRWISLHEVSARTGIRLREIQTLIEDLQAVDLMGSAGEGAPFTVECRGGCTSARSLVEGEDALAGPVVMRRLGLFGYSLAEVEHRLALISFGLGEAEGAQRQHLMRAEQKLQRWQEHLKREVTSEQANLLIEVPTSTER